MRQALLINGVPASGKSTISAELVALLNAAGTPAVPFGLDTVKEALFAQIGTGDREYNRMLGRASYHAIFNSIASFPDALLPVIDAWHGFQPREVLASHLELARIERVIEVWVHIAPAVAADRYRARTETRRAGHLSASYADELFILAKRATPMAIGEVITVDGEGTEMDALATRVLSALGQ